MEETPERLSAKPSWLITQLAVHVRRLVFDGFTASGARGYHYRILAALYEFGPASQAELGRRCRVDRSDVVAAVNELVEQGYVERTPDPDHGRRNRVTLTKGGVRQLRRMDGVLDQVQDDLLKPLSAEDRQTLTCLLSRLLAQHEPE
ncbi:MarR family transcriptional regulator [Streptomyces sp. CA-210063]|uniref:MarR family winged helix-turn-helix transcriptional regulator n=1 Tax=Streptomyces sp. CA-210063 TaxID=2801029 RepID=UPI00214AACF5|nr:MarR family transcriptional regulator [Streptomyces sp. CA-210063]UUU30043.1 MarR family transcriptional regulator [Streptomyces sp. CA-210063]